ncbi:MAG: hypothetical protein J5I50_01025 [Chitinophagaceae bacterium]|nr:hypothetical protein [Chitinophagaceae bacterium]
MAILKFRVYWEEDESVYRDIVIRHTQTFFDFHNAILKSFEFDNKHQATFYRSNDHWKRGRQIVVERYEMDYKAEPLIMSETTIGSELRDPNQKFIYVYDFDKQWTFHIELINVNKNEELPEYPSVVRTEGIGPSQYGTKGMVNEKLAEIEEKYDLNTAVLPDGYESEGEDDDTGMEGEDDDDRVPNDEDE